MAHAVSFQVLSEDAAAASSDDIELGDVYLREVTSGRKKTTDVCAVISQACDLERGKTDSVLLIRGTASRRSSKRVNRTNDSGPVIRTDIFQHESENLIIDWHASDLEAVRVSGFVEWLQNHRYEKVARLRPVQALALQQKFASHLSRIGLPDMPPPYRFPNVEVTVLRGGKPKPLMTPWPAKRELVCLIGEGSPDCVVMEHVLEEIRVELRKLVGEADVDQPQLEAALKTLESLDTFRQLRSSQLREQKALIGNILVWDREAAYSSSGDAQPKGSWLTIALYGGSV